MNLIGKCYLELKRQLHNPSLNEMSHQEILTRQFQSEWEELKNIEDRGRLDAILQHAATHVPFYQRYFAEHTDKNPSILNNWPILTRDLLRKNFEALQSHQPLAGQTWTHASGGSTGKPVAVVHDEFFAAKAQALRNLSAKLFYDGPHYNKLILWGMNQEVERQKSGVGTLRQKIKNRLLRLGELQTTHINTFDFTREKFEQCADVLATQKPRFIMGYAGSVYQLAKYLDEQRIPVKRSPVVITTTAQTLYPFMREKIEQVFGCRVCDHYGSREVGPIAWQHKDGDMYFPKFFSKLEVVNGTGGACKIGEQGSILVTTLHNFSMPLIRYEIGDSGTRGGDKLYQGYPFATLTRISGKSNEEFLRKDGTLVHGQFFINLFYYRPWLDEFHVVQRQHELVEVLYVLKHKNRKPPQADIDEINQRIKSVMTAHCEVRWREVDEIPPTKAGKRLYIRSEVKKN